MLYTGKTISQAFGPVSTCPGGRLLFGLTVLRYLNIQVRSGRDLMHARIDQESDLKVVMFSQTNSYYCLIVQGNMSDGAQRNTVRHISL